MSLHVKESSSNQSPQEALPLSQYLPKVSQLAYGCMGLGGGWNDAPVTMEDIKQTQSVIDTVLEAGISLFDHADIYTFGKAEAAFGRVLKDKPSLRGEFYLQSKCGIRLPDESGGKRYDFSAQWIEQSLNNILDRLSCDYLDVFMLHRPDPLMELDEVAETLARIHQSGKAKFFGVSNMSHHQIQYLQSALDMPIVVNQLEMSLLKNEFVTQSISVSGTSNSASHFPQGTLEYCGENGIQLQSWGSLAQGQFSRHTSLNSENSIIRETTRFVFQLAERYRTSPESIVLAFLTRHPSKIQPVIGTTNLDRIRACGDVSNVQLSREDWYGLLQRSLGNEVP
ncbi:aldo/keto reductase [Vibrio tapetis subsp. quintayensis]|uniref:aldo/keto reductase n=1 Tax=Vibrio tapetis TaxID=52443 RepID=UPI0025B30CCE|nr:aldo/keto reductase [Vibrio tapetis]MDN3680997.1 aldo/keto reductase [Vibrio tapetis subsp. quintayensis]